jgi:hypothetical protein
LELGNEYARNISLGRRKRGMVPNQEIMFRIGEGFGCEIYFKVKGNTKMRTVSRFMRIKGISKKGSWDFPRPQKSCGLGDSFGSRRNN